MTLADELPKRFDSQGVARSIGERIQAQEIGPLLTASNAIATATTNLNTATAKAQKAHGAIERSATTLPWVISAVTCALVAVAASAIIIQSDRVSIRREFSEHFKACRRYRALARQGRTLRSSTLPTAPSSCVIREGRKRLRGERKGGDAISMNPLLALGLGIAARSHISATTGWPSRGISSLRPPL